MTKEEEDVIIADSFQALTYPNRKNLPSVFGGNEDCGQNYGRALIKSRADGVYNSMREDFFSEAYRRKVLDGLAARDITCVTYKSQGYPEFLRHIPDPPLVLYCKGNLSLLKDRCFAVVGSRRTAPWAITACKNFCGKLSAYFTVVTGVADGADTAAAEGALGSGRLICVLPGGLDHIYPAISANLVAKVQKKGLVISECPPSVKVRKYSFSARNRIIAGIAEGVLVVSAAEKSGALITADYAADYGRDVFAFPYSLGVASGEGCNNLIKKGAGLADRVEDILYEYGIDTAQKENLPDGKEGKALKIIRELGNAHTDIIARELNIRPHEASALCSLLEIKGLIVKSGGNRYSPVR